MVNKRKVIWDNAAKEYLKKSLQYIKQDSLQNAAKLKDSIK
jgi:plasmid stabilization system protein ParE